MTDFDMSPAFPQSDFHAFGIAASAFFPAVMSDEALLDPEEKRRQFDWAWQAVRYRYRSCAECNEEFKRLVANPSALQAAGWDDEEQMYKLERSIYQFFTSALSVFDSFAFCLYLYGNALKPGNFPDIAKPRNITRATTTKAFMAAYQTSSITVHLDGLSKDSRFTIIDKVRNLVGHRLSGRYVVRASNTKHSDGTQTHWKEETWHIPGAGIKLKFDSEMLQRHLDDISDLLASVTSAALQFAELQKQAHMENDCSTKG